MTDDQAKKIGVASVRRGRKKVKNLVLRVVSYFLEVYLMEMRIVPKRSLVEDVHKALREPNHPARHYTKIDEYMSKAISIDVIEEAIAGGILVVKI